MVVAAAGVVPLSKHGSALCQGGVHGIQTDRSSTQDYELRAGAVDDGGSRPAGNGAAIEYEVNATI